MGEDIEFEIPAGRRHIIERPRLTRLLDETSARVIMLVAPAGYGKTTLARQWLANRPHAWYQASAASSDVAALALGLADSTAKLSEPTARRLREWLRTAREPEHEIELVAELLSKEFDEWPTDALLVIDDYHLLTSPASEELIGFLPGLTQVRFLITSRKRPSWASPRRLLYGELYELGQSGLAMSFDEAHEVLSSGDIDAAGALVALADGWPAVIGLAAFTDLSALLAEDALPSQLHEYIAEELYASLHPTARIGLCQLALLPMLTPRLAEQLLGANVHETVNDGVRTGFLIPAGADTFELHPLLRTFLLHKFTGLDSPLQTETVDTAFVILLRTEAWEEAFDLLRRSDRFDLLEALVTAALDDLAQHGRLETLRTWAEYGTSHDVCSPVFRLLEAECAFRKGMHERAKALARQASEGIDPQSALASKAFYRAGQNAHLTDDPEEAITDFRQAKVLARTPTDARNAIWGQFITTVELEQPGASELLKQFGEAGAVTVDDLVRIHNGRLYLATRVGPLSSAIAHAHPMTSLVPDARDPIVRVSFWHIYAAALRLATYYDEAQDAVAEGLQETDKFHLEFARPHMVLTRAAAAIGVRRFAEASNILDHVAHLSEEHKDEYLSMNARAMRCRLLLLEGAADAALSATQGSWLRVSSKGQKAEFLASRALAYAHIGRLAQAYDLLHEADALSRELEATSLCQWVHALLVLQEERSDVKEFVMGTFEATLRSGMVDMFVLAYRLDKRVLTLVWENPASHEVLSEILARARDRALARELGLTVAPDSHTTTRFAQLTLRERDVFELITEGRSNKEIAKALFLSEVTVKVHVRNILKKLGVRTRTEAAVLGTRTLER